jgi:hypothetical protein
LSQRLKSVSFQEGEFIPAMTVPSSKEEVADLER